MSKPEQFEVIIVGGGLVGATTACILADAGINIAMLDMRRPATEWDKDTIDLRVSALTKASENIFRSLGIWEDIVANGAGAYMEMQVWDGQGEGKLHFDSADTCYQVLGHIVENRNTVAALWNRLESLPAAHCITGVKVSDMQSSEQGRCLTLSDGRTVEAPLIIAADGRDSALRKMAGIDVTGWPYHQDGLVATIDTENSHKATAWQRFLPEGPLAFLPLHTGQCSIVWTLKHDTAQQYLQLSDEDFLEKLEQASNGILGKMLKTSQKAAFPLRFQYANAYTAENLALVGDAAHAMHPLAGQGANAGLLDAAAIAELIVDAKQRQRPLGSRKLLRSYERWRKGDNLLMLCSMDVLNKTYGVSSEPFVQLRSTGMNWINHSAMVKNYFNHHAMGLRDDLPERAKRQLEI